MTVAHLGGGVLCAGQLSVAGNTEDTITLLLWGHLAGERSSLGRDELQAGLLDSKGDLSLCMLLAAPLSTPLAPQICAWARRHIVFPCFQTADGVKPHLDLFQAPSVDHNQLAFLLCLPLHRRKVSLPALPDGIPSVTSGYGLQFRQLGGHFPWERVDEVACLSLRTALPRDPYPLALEGSLEEVEKMAGRY